MSRAAQIHKAVRTGQKARVALSGTSGSGKTWTALSIATELANGGPILSIDTERGSSELYSDYFDFEALDWQPPYDPRELAQELNALSKKYAVIICDSLTHFWQGEGGTLDIVDAAGQRARGNKFAGWKTGTPAQNALVEALLTAECHVIVTMRAKTEYVLEEDGKGRTAPRKVGMAPIQRDGIEFEFTVTADLDQEHRLMITKTRCHLLADKVFQPKREREMAVTLREWLDGAVAAPAPEPQYGQPPVVDNLDENATQATAEQLTHLRRILAGTIPTVVQPTPEQVQAILVRTGSGLKVEPGWRERLSKDECAALIEALHNNPMPDPDRPSDLPEPEVHLVSPEAVADDPDDEPLPFGLDGASVT
jgi:hypothetical protein